MILLLFSVTGLLIGLLTGGSIRGIARYPLKGALLPVIALLLKAGAAALFEPQTGAVAVSLAQYSLVFVFLFLNRRHIIWPAIVFAGSLLNLLVVALNGGCMPVDAALLGDATQRLALLRSGRIFAYCLAGESTRLPFLGDIIRLGPPGIPIGFASIGDIILCAGVALLAFCMTKTKLPADENKESGQVTT